jgi:hypothetical protein
VAPPDPRKHNGVRRPMRRHLASLDRLAARPAPLTPMPD